MSATKHATGVDVRRNLRAEMTGPDVNGIFCFSLEQLGANTQSIIERTKSSFLGLPLDHYDARRARVVFLKQHLPREADRLDAVFPDYYVGRVSSDVLEPYLEGLPAEKARNYGCIAPFRRRGVARFEVFSGPRGRFRFEEIDVPRFSQACEGYLSLPRRFEKLDSSMTHSEDYQLMLAGFARHVREQRTFRKMVMTVHHMHVFVTPDQPMSTNSPEGVHQDGSDYIVSACVIERHNVTGGISKIYGDDKRSVVLSETCLEPGQGLCHADRGSNLWHEVTPVRLRNAELPIGFRSTIGLDMELE